MQPLTEQRSEPDPVVYGFLRIAAAVAAGRRRALSDALAHYCLQHELTLGGIFTERHSPDGSTSPAFTGLLDAVALAGTYGVVLPTDSHLGPSVMGEERQKQLVAAGVRLMVMRVRKRAHSPRAGNRSTPSNTA